MVFNLLMSGVTAPVQVRDYHQNCIIFDYILRTFIDLDIKLTIKLFLSLIMTKNIITVV